MSMTIELSALEDRRTDEPPQAGERSLSLQNARAHAMAAVGDLG